MLMPMTYIGKELATFYLWTKEGNDRAIDLVDRALKLEPNFVPAIILAENCWALRHTNGWSPLADAREKSAHYARLAVQLDPDNAEALAILSRRTSFINQAHEEAMTLAERAVAINPNSAFAWRNSGFAFAFGGVPDKALAHFERAMRLHPRDPRAHDILHGMALALIQLERDTEAIAVARKAVQQSPTFAAAWRSLTAALALTGQVDEARRALVQALKLNSTCTISSMNLRVGHSERARSRLFEGWRIAGMPE